MMRNRPMPAVIAAVKAILRHVVGAAAMRHYMLCLKGEKEPLSPRTPDTRLNGEARGAEVRCSSGLTRILSFTFTTCVFRRRKRVRDTCAKCGVRSNEWKHSCSGRARPP